MSQYPALLGTVSYLGVVREYDEDLRYRVSLAHNLGDSTWPSDLLKGDENASDLRKNFMVCLYDKTTSSVVETSFYPNEPAAMAHIRKLLRNSCGFSEARANKVKDNWHLRNFKKGDDLMTHVRKYIHIDEED